MKRERLFIFLMIGILLAVTVVLLWLGRNNTTPAFVTKTLRRDTLDAERQVLEVQADSLLNLVERLNQQHPVVFSFDLSDDELMIHCQDGHERAFNRLFLNENNLGAYKKIHQTQMDIDIKAYRFDLPVKHYQKQRFVKIPAEILQSILLSLED